MKDAGAKSTSAWPSSQIRRDLIGGTHQRHMAGDFDDGTSDRNRETFIGLAESSDRGVNAAHVFSRLRTHTRDPIRGKRPEVWKQIPSRVSMPPLAQRRDSLLRVSHQMPQSMRRSLLHHRHEPPQSSPSSRLRIPQMTVCAILSCWPDSAENRRILRFVQSSDSICQRRHVYRKVCAIMTFADVHFGWSRTVLAISISTSVALSLLLDWTLLEYSACRSTCLCLGMPFPF